MAFSFQFQRTGIGVTLVFKPHLYGNGKIKRVIAKAHFPARKIAVHFIRIARQFDAAGLIDDSLFLPQEEVVQLGANMRLLSLVLASKLLPRRLFRAAMHPFVVIAIQPAQALIQLLQRRQLALVDVRLHFRPKARIDKLE